MIKNKIYCVLSALLAAIILFSCKQPETVVISGDPETAGAGVSEKDTAKTATAEFRQLNIGEVDRIPTLDPLFADNTATMRAIQLVFEGLVRYNENNAVIPSVAKRWEVSEDSLSYTFVLRPNIYYHDSGVFTTGTGRKLLARDVKFTFERMARNTVPPKAASLFMNIRGFKSYFQEQHEILFPPHRRLVGVEGIEVPNDSTVVFNLKSKDSNFLQKLASPFAVIYPREALGTNPPETFTAVGSGPFRLSQKQGDSQYIFGKNNNYHESGKPLLNRVDLKIYANETELFKSFAKEEIHFIPEMGPHTIKGALDESGRLMSTYSDQFRVIRSGGSLTYALYSNPSSDFPPKLRNRLLHLLQSNQPFQEIPEIEVQFSFIDTTDPADSLVKLENTPYTLQTTFIDDPYLQQLAQHLSGAGKEYGISLEIIPLRIPVESVEIYARNHVPAFRGDKLKLNSHQLMKFKIPHLGIHRKPVKNLRLNSFAWWLDFRNVTLPESTNL